MTSMMQRHYESACYFSRQLAGVLRAPEDAVPQSFVAWGPPLQCQSYTRISGYRSYGQEDIEAQMGRLLAGLYGQGQDLLAGLAFDGSGWAMYLGSSCPRDELTQQVAGRLPLVRQQAVGPDGGDALFRSYPFGGCIGNLGPGRIQWDAVLRRIGQVPCAIVLILKHAPALVDQDQRTLDRLCRDLESFSTRRFPVGFTGSQTRTVSDPVLQQGSQAAGAFRQRLLDCRQQHGCVAALWYGAQTPADADRTGSAIAGSLEPTPDHLRGGAYAQPLRENTFQFDGFYLPWQQVGGFPGLPLLHNPLTCVLTPQELGQMVPAPYDAHPGFWVDQPQRDSRSFHEFDVTPHAVHGLPVPLGNICGTDQEEAVGTGDLVQHTLLAGASGAGKSTSIRRLVMGLDRLGIPVLIMEPVKGSFSDLPSYGVDTRIYSSGIGGIPLVFNPFIPEEMTTTHTHIKSLVTAITAATDNEAPIPQALEMVLTQAYRDHGWASDELVLPGSVKSFPTFSQVRDMILPFFRESRLYQGEVKTNVSSALYVRMSALAGFRFLQGTGRLPAQELLSRNALIRFDGLDMLPDKCAFANFVLINLNEHLRAAGACDGLRHAIILDEAHNFLLKPTGVNSSAAAVSEFFGNLLSEIREYGVGMIVADQRVSILNQSVVENTGVKILHAMSCEEDAELAAGALKLSDYQRQLFQTMPAGTALVSIRGQRPITQVRIRKPTVTGAPACQMCRYCRYTHLCCRGEVLPRLADAPVRAWSSALLADMHDSAQLREAIRAILAELDALNAPPHIRQCLFGHVVEQGVPQASYRQFLNHFYTQSYQ